MSAGLPSDEVVDDYKNSLDDLVTNDRISIGNLTVIAKECIEHAQAIARVLENHILRVSLPQLRYLAFATKFLTLPYIGSSCTEIASLLCPGLYRKECGDSIHSLLWSELVSYIYEYFCLG